ncbi:hypothetical protein E7744_03675 [Citricoccus sp. SGAir0253]|uniref:hypothetical protein n=1 Tax=Citricoccus sp. SGAir0253 TaxID=2567881 RepID=UPI0010CCC60C|nr:hypothetical protein [Citricoccus sp. SGAir0253]QCU77415.1 hypothetical protein E7744_03675 [Citricoccus sp. SGAir0253]
MTTTPSDAKRGPAGPGRMAPGRRTTVMVVVDRPDPEEALRESMDWVEAFERDCGLVLDPEATELYGVATAEDLRESLQPPRDGSVAEYLDFICVDGAWLHPGDCPVAPPDSNGAPAWSWAYYRTVMGAPDGAFCILWDLMPLPAAA